MAKQKQQASIVRRMIIAVAAGFAVGFLCLILKAQLKGTGGDGFWNVIEALLFQDITQTPPFRASACFISSDSSSCADCK